MSHRSTVRRGNVELSVYESGDAARPTVLCVHGYPDDHTVWDGVVTRLAGRFHVVTYDVRGCGASSAPRSRDAYRIEELAADLRAVADEVSPDAPVHLVGHDWGSIQAWQAVTDPRIAPRFASFTTMSGPCIEHIGQWTARCARRTGRPRGWGALASQSLRSGYIGFFALPVLPELAVRTGLLRLCVQALQGAEGIRPGRRVRDGDAARARDGARLPGRIDRRGLRWGIEMYRANMAGRLFPRRPDASRASAASRPSEERRTDVPVQLIVARHDAYVTVSLADEAARWAPNLRRREIPTGHWAPRSHPARIARLIAEFADTSAS